MLESNATAGASWTSTPTKHCKYYWSYRLYTIANKAYYELGITMMAEENILTLNQRLLDAIAAAV